jgi:hypothetical protein
MPYYVIIDLNSIEPRQSDGRSVGRVLTLGGEDDAVLPVFTSLDHFWAFVDEYYAEDASVQPTTFPMTPFRLAQMIKPLGGAGRLDTLVFNPVALSAGRWRNVGKPISVAHYCQFANEIRPGIEELASEEVARFGEPPPEFEAFKEVVLKDVMQRFKPQLKEVADNARARMEEWQDGDSS